MAFTLVTCENPGRIDLATSLRLAHYSALMLTQPEALERPLEITNALEPFDMRLSKLEVHNFRSIEHATIKPDSLTTLIGKNSVGKSNLLAAIRFFFSASAKSCSSDDICQFTEDTDAWVEATFSHLNDSEKEDLAKYLLHDGSIRIRRSISIAPDGQVTAVLNGYLESPDEEWLQDNYEGYNDQTRWSELGIDVWEYADKSKSGKITKDAFKQFTQSYISAHSADLQFNQTLSTTEFRGRQSSATASLPHIIFVPAIGDVSSVVYGLKSSLLNQIVGATIGAAQDLPEFITAQASLNAAQEFVNPSSHRLAMLTKIERQLEEQLRIWPDTKCTIRTELESLADLLTGGLKLVINDGSDSDLPRTGSGIQRQVLFQVFRMFADFRAKRGIFEDADETPSTDSRSSIIVFEEPELFLHPQAQEAFYDDLLKVSESDQVFLSTHSNYLIRLDNANGLHILRRETPASPTTIVTAPKDWMSSDVRKRLKELNLFTSDVSKVFFADRVVILEGQEDIIYVVKTATDHEDCFDRRVSIIQAFGKGNIPKIQRILNAFCIPYIAVYDKDPDNPPSERITAQIVELVNEGQKTNPQVRIEEFDPTLPAVCQGAILSKKKDNVMEAWRFMNEDKPTEEFCMRIANIFKLS